MCVFFHINFHLKHLSKHNELIDILRVSQIYAGIRVKYVPFPYFNQASVFWTAFSKINHKILNENARERTD